MVSTVETDIQSRRIVGKGIGCRVKHLLAIDFKHHVGIIMRCIIASRLCACGKLAHLRTVKSLNHHKCMPRHLIRCSQVEDCIVESEAGYLLSCHRRCGHWLRAESAIGVDGIHLKIYHCIIVSIKFAKSKHHIGNGKGCCRSIEQIADSCLLDVGAPCIFGRCAETVRTVTEIRHNKTLVYIIIVAKIYRLVGKIRNSATYIHSALVFLTAKRIFV